MLTFSERGVTSVFYGTE